MRIRKNSHYRKTVSFGIVFLLLVNVCWVATLVQPVFASPDLTLKWVTRANGAPFYRPANLIQTNIMPLAADLITGDDGVLEIVVTGGTTSSGAVTVLNGTDGSVIWQTLDTVVYPRAQIGMHSPFEIADLNNDGNLEIIVGSNYPLVLNGDDGSVFWSHTEYGDPMAYENCCSAFCQFMEPVEYFIFSLCIQRTSGFI